MRGRNLMLAWLWAAVLLGGLAQAALKTPKLQDKREMVRGLLATLEDRDRGVVALALEVIRSNNLQDDPEVRARLLVFMPRLGALLKDPDKKSRVIAAWAVGALGEAAKAYSPALAGLLEDPEAEVRRTAAQALGALGPAAREHAPRLLGLLKDPDADVRSAAAQALGALGPAAREHTPRLLELLKASEASARSGAVQALGALGPAAREHAPRLLELLKDPDADVRSAATQALGALGEAPQEHARRLVELLNDPDSTVRKAAAQALGTLGEAAREHAPRLVDLLQDPSEEVRRAAALALGALGEAAREQAPRLLELLKNPYADVRSEAAQALGAMGQAAKEHTPRLIELLKDPDENTRAAVTQALRAMGEVNTAHAPLLAGLLKDPNKSVRRAAAQALGALGETAKEHAPRLAVLLKDPDAEVRGAAAQALGFMGEAARDQAPHLAGLLKDPEELVRSEAAWALGTLGVAHPDLIPCLVNLLKGSSYAVMNAKETFWFMARPPRESAPLLLGLLEGRDSDVRGEVGEILAGMAPLPLPQMAPLLAMTGLEPGQRHRWLMVAHIAGGGDPRVERSLRWLVGRASSDLPTELPIAEARETLRGFAELWPATEKYSLLRDDLAQQIARVADLASGQWESQDLELLALHEKNLRASYRMHAQNLRAAGASSESWSTVKTFAWTWAGHIGFWVLLLFFYPRSPQVQAVFFWNPWVRAITGFGYVGLLLTWVPFLRRRLLAPFAPQLLADADLERFSDESYFKDSDVILQPSARRQPLLAALPRLQGQVILEGASGLGKSLFIKYLLRRSEQLAVFLPAERCKIGVLEAIQAKLEGQAKDTTFLQSIIYSGALDIYIDGLNEVTAETRARIVQFAERNFHGNILLATQRMEWTPPTTARLYVLQPLSDARISEFLASREPLLGERARLRGPEYREACERFVQQSLSSEQPEEVRRALREQLSNPMDLTVIAQMLSEGHSPDLFRLRQQQYELMAADYREVNLLDFPLKEFAEEAYKLRIEDRQTLPEDWLSKELLRLESFKMVVRRQWKGLNGQEHREWRFRHDKIQEFFIAQTFLGPGNPRIVEHMGDPRFRGVYFLLALLLDPEHARQLRDQLVVRAAQTRDHTVSDEFVTLLEVRREAVQAQLTPPRDLGTTGT